MRPSHLLADTVKEKKASGALPKRSGKTGAKVIELPVRKNDERTTSRQTERDVVPTWLLSALSGAPKLQASLSSLARRGFPDVALRRWQRAFMRYMAVSLVSLDEGGSVRVPGREMLAKLSAVASISGRVAPRT